MPASRRTSINPGLNSGSIHGRFLVGFSPKPPISAAKGHVF
jgi:hypothetical protein